MTSESLCLDKNKVLCAFVNIIDNILSFKSKSQSLYVYEPIIAFKRTSMGHNVVVVIEGREGVAKQLRPMQKFSTS